MSRGVGPYELLAPLGQGGAGQVFRARHRALGVERAVKVLASTSPTAAERFAREARALAAVRDPHVVAVHEAGVDPGGVRWIAMDLVAGEPLDRVLARGPLPLARALEVVGQVARGVEALHTAGVVHRDLKPQNVVLDPAGRAVVIDLGLAVAPDADERLTRTGAWVGTAQYVAPEQLAGAPPTPRTDVHALGLLLHEAVTGRPVFDGETSDEVLRQVLAPSRLAPSAVDPSLPAALDDLVARATAPDPADRFPRAGALADALERLRAAPGPSARQARRRRARRRAAAAALGLLALAAALALGLRALAARRAAPTPAAPLAPVASVAPATSVASRAPVASTPGEGASGRRGPRGGPGPAVRLALGPGSGLVVVAFATNGRLVTLDRDGGRLHAWDLEAPATPAMTWRLEPPTTALATLPGERAVVARGDVWLGAPLAVVDLRAPDAPPRPLATLPCHALAVDARGHVVVGGAGAVEVVDPTTGAVVERLSAPDLGDTAFLAVAASDRFVAATGWRAAAALAVEEGTSTLVVWPRGGGAPVRTEALTKLKALAASPRDPELLVVGWASGAVTLDHPLDPASQPRHLVAPGASTAGLDLLPAAHGVIVRALAVTPDGARLASAAGAEADPRGREVRWWSLPDGAPLGPALPVPGPMGSLAVSPDGRRVAVGYLDGTVEVWPAPP